MRTWTRSTVVLLAAVMPTVGLVWAGVSPSQAEGNEVGIDDSNSDAQQWKFVPAEITIAPGQKVLWKNSGQYTHTITANDKSFDSGGLDPGKSFEFTFAKAGDYAYHCEPHPWKKGVVHVK